MKEIVGKTKVKKDVFIKCLLVNENETSDKKAIGRLLNACFVNIDPKITSAILATNISFKTYLTKSEACLIKTYLLLKNVKKVTKPWRVIRLMNIFNNSVKFSIFSEKMKLVKFTPIFESGKEELLTNCRPISLLPCLLKNSRENHE